MRCRFSLAALLVVSLAAGAADKPKGTSLDGTWTVQKYERGGRTLDEASAKSIKFVIVEDKMVLVAGIGFTGAKDHNLKLDTTNKPGTIDVIPQDGRNKGKPFEGIYELKEDELTICVAAPGTPRPKEFATKAGDPVIRIVLKRDK